ncbi:hypothetical protein LCI18_011809 [Fusarium solani-melongenae]|uniref:Uncharacterized protein n=1 Tax=Fusarium solani subsp. cucurbitae TaxID=2747967 RepID=A0ACD3ZHU1_FUSSC|nr:hypothetical protein LCI18_011809 [Fusarium solani-melongenae]
MGHRKRGQEENGKDPEFWRGDSLTIVGSDLERHNRLRKILSHSFSARAMMDHQPIILHYVSLLMERLKAAAAGGQAQDMTSWYNWTTFDVIGDLTFGEPFGCLDQSHYHSWVQLIFKHIKGMAISTSLIRLPFTETLINLITPKDVTRDVQSHWEFVTAQVGKRLAFKDPRPDFMKSIIHAHEKDQISHMEILRNAHMLIVAGSETTATAMSGITYLLATNKPIQKKLQAELRETFNNEDEINLLSVQKLDYMMAVIQEGLRLFPPNPSSIPRKAPPSGTTIRGEYIPPNTILHIFHWQMFHNPKLFRDPEAFVPARWLGEKKYDSDHKKALQPFSVGPRNCVGKNLAYAEMRLILSRMVWTFDIELDPRSTGWFEKNRVYFLWDKPPLYVRLIPRNQGAQLAEKTVTE